MIHRYTSLALAAFAMTAAPVLTTPVAAQSANYLQCVPVARELSGVQIYGDARTWWDQAHGRYSRGSAPRKGAVMVFKPHRNMQLGHVAYVSEVIDSRTVRLTHANWSEINGARGQMERDVPAIDVSPNNDWSEVRVWYHSMQGPGVTHWPLHGFIYADGTAVDDAQPRMVQASAPSTQRQVRRVANPSARNTAVFTAQAAPRMTAPRVVQPRRSALPVVPPRTRGAGQSSTPSTSGASVTFQIAFAEYSR